MKIHLDLDCYFVSAERVRDKSLIGKPVVVAKSGDNEIFSKDKKECKILDDVGAFNNALQFSTTKSDWKREFIDEEGNIHGIVIAKSYEAKKYGINTGTHLREALHLCKNLIIIKSDHLYYQLLSQQLKEYLNTKIPVIEQYSIDEFFGDVGGWIRDSDVEMFIKELQEEILHKFGLPATIGASNSKWIAKLLTDKNKPYGTKLLKDDEIMEYVRDIGIDEFAGIGKNISKKLKSYGIHTIGEAIKYPQHLTSYGKMGKDLYNRMRGTDNEEVIPNRDRRAIGISRNFKPISCRDEYIRRAIILSRYLSYTIQKLGLNPTSYYFKIKYEYGAKNYQTVSLSRLFSEKLLISVATKAFRDLDIHKGYSIKYIGLSASNFANENKTYNLIDYDQDIKDAHISSKLTHLRDKYGIDIIKYASEG